MASIKNVVQDAGAVPLDLRGPVDDAFLTAFQISSIRMIYYDTDMIIRDVNRAFLENDDFTRADVIGRPMRTVMGDAIWERARPAVEAALRGEPQVTTTWGLRRATRERLMRIRHEPVFDAAGTVTGLIVLIEDTTELFELENRVSMHEEVFRQSTEAMSIVGLDFRFIWSNPATAKTWGYTAEEIIGKRLVDVIGERGFLERAKPHLDRCFSGEQVEYQFKHDFANGDIVYFELNCVPFRSSTGEVIAAAVTRRDVTSATMMKAELLRQARQDALTGLANRYALEEELEMRVAQCAATFADSDVRLSALVLVDLDGFKVVNDIAGHSAGDALLKQVADLLRTIDKVDMIARLGGDEFALVLSACTAAKVEAACQTIISGLETTPFDWDGARYSVRASVGVAMLDEEMFEATVPSIYDVINWADRACRLAKERGGSRMAVYHAADTEIQARFEETGNLRVVQDALLNGRFELYAMPIAPIDGVSGQYFEVLLRIVGTDGQMLVPAAFISAAERHQMMVPVDKWVVRNVLERLRTAPADLQLTVNLSGQSVGDPEFRDFLVAALDERPEVHGRLAFEITETSAVRSMETARDLIKALRGRGCGIVLDDFGSGLSSFGYLRKFDVDMLKIDGNIIGDVANDPVQQTIVAGIVAVAAAMDVRVVAEFVEDEQTLETLRDLGVSLVQGYHVGRPAAWSETFGR
ncbi:EAL domain-containing protein [Stappia sp. ES.058]|uniref:EAL domain-containing protein n=1 Tax=Stappia sp. ES.058 TaxID=1881061 RepID=UPI00087BB051|nr:EAL domain-containing protein [Stappia sp. ES.058]SDT93689.1 PAS domain S-box-containing protein/diguanylate cyclase (GGDEF) domain-containing protein [Stappia sp. ES.058]